MPIGAVVFQLVFSCMAHTLYHAAAKMLWISSTTIAAAFSFGAGRCAHLLVLSETANMGHIHSTSKKEKQELILRALFCALHCCILMGWLSGPCPVLRALTVALLVACKLILQNRRIYFIISAFWTDTHFFRKI